MAGWTRHDNIRFDEPFITQIDGNLWQGGCEEGLILPAFIEHLYSLYIWEAYDVKHKLKTFEAIKMYDSTSEEMNEVIDIARRVQASVADGPTLVHCQAGLNRSSLIAGTVLWLNGMPSAEIPAFLRSKRGPAVLCNPAFARFVAKLDETAKR